ncbi:nickel-dependent hydrogenase large subunit [Anaerocolumna sp. MB42-C2]|uniref:nickel-dependent hydrogenase large subunit n=1 Tax=Anaerocolumna sp. MB42-C2 TaxID=3070997 RepID=UPI0027DFB353|nr:nickel-dependent hydrogenase large subunit [Anaerocolumna sp. MB42-C2]WMJ86487.1 nickel-dependent hydrogenase large subunit [Anaerocolumna sp. MB42-C2]
MGEIITIDPITRISGFMEIQAEVENNVIVNVNSVGLLYRGFEQMLKGRSPMDAIYFTQRICGICSSAHATASALALENAMKLNISLNDSYLRDIIHGMEFVQNHIRHFYQLAIPSFARIKSLKLVDDQGYSDFRLPEEINSQIEMHYAQSIELSRLAHEALAVLGGKAPHNHGIFLGGVTTIIDSYNLSKIKTIIDRILSFVSNVMLEDMGIIADYYSDYFHKGISYPNFMSYGIYNKYEDQEITFVNAGVMIEGVLYPFDQQNITEQIKYAWYQRNQDYDSVDLTKEDAYSFIKAPRYNSNPMEVGPLARLIISGDYTTGHSCMDRYIARVIETDILLKIMKKIADRIELLPNNQQPYVMPDEAYGIGLTDTTRGALGHWLQIKNQVIEHYNIITPSVWNLSPRDAFGVLGVVENALIGTEINNIKEPVEIGRIVRSYDPCVSCATHLIGDTGGKIIEVIV